MNPISIIGMTAVGISLIGVFVSISDDQSSQIDASTLISEKHLMRVVEASSLQAITTVDDNISIVNLGNTDTEILEIRVLDDAGHVIQKKTLTEPISASRTTKIIVDSNVMDHIRNMKLANNTQTG